jgi:UrcA family protein
MSIKSAVINASPLLSAALAACMLFAVEAAAGSHPVTVAIKVSTHGLDLNAPAGAQELYRRVEDAAWVACHGANRIGLEPSPDPYACYETALGQAVASVHIPLVTLAYLETHSLGQAAAHGIDVPVQAKAQ